MTAPTAVAVRDAERPREQHHGVDLGATRRVDPRDLITRFTVGALISVIAGSVSLVAGARIGGLFLAFPAILPAAVTLLEKREGIGEACSDVRGAAIGAMAMVAFACTAAVLMTTRWAIVLIAALMTWMFASALIYLAMRGVVHVLGERLYLPEISTVEVAGVAARLRERGLTIATAESCTGGLLAALLSSIPRASDYFVGAVVAYDEPLKTRLLGVSPQLIDARGTVDPDVARTMADGVRHTTGADVGVSITGLSGSGQEQKSAGLTYVAVALLDAPVMVRKRDGDRGPGRNEEAAVRLALRTLADALDQLPGLQASRHRTG